MRVSTQPINCQFAGMDTWQDPQCSLELEAFTGFMHTALCGGPVGGLRGSWQGRKVQRVDEQTDLWKLWWILLSMC